jgi:hypothetical protein
MTFEMKNEVSEQLELFLQAKDSSQKKKRILNAMSSYIWIWEKSILIIIGLVITGIVSYSLGVEKGKKITQLKTDSRLDVAFKTQPKISTSISGQPIPESPPVEKDELKEYIQNYTIQVASFLNRINAQKEADTLKRKGLSSIVLPKGKFTIVCVGSFSNREEAESFLPKLKKQYQDCRIRRL